MRFKFSELSVIQFSFVPA